MATPAQHKRETAPGLQASGAMAASYVSVLLPAAQQLALAPLLGPYPQAHEASQLRSLRRSPADFTTGRITSSGFASNLIHSFMERRWRVYVELTIITYGIRAPLTPVRAAVRSSATPRVKVYFWGNNFYTRTLV